MKKKASKPKKVINIFIITVIAVIVLSVVFCTDEIEPIESKEEPQIEVVVKTPAQIEEENHAEWVKKQFSAWDGSHRCLVSLLKDNLNDAKSFEHVETTYITEDNDLIVTMKYRAKNGFGGMVLETIKARTSYEYDTITVIE